MASAPFKVTVGTTPTRIVDYSPNRTVIMIFNPSDVTVYIGVGANLTTDNGFPLPSNQGMVLAREFGDDPEISYYAVVASGTAELRVWEGFGTTTGYLLEQIKALLQKT